MFSIWTVGHSNLDIEEFLARIAPAGIEVIADVRRFPGSRRHPQYGQAALRDALAAHDIDYRWFEALGGRRQPEADSINTAWRNASFRGYADYMASEDFQVAFAALLQLAQQRRTALMCSEVLWWRCHRALLADALRARGIDVRHIGSDGRSTPHPLTSPARIVAGRLTYACANRSP